MEYGNVQILPKTRRPTTRTWLVVGPCLAVNAMVIMLTIILFLATLLQNQTLPMDYTYWDCTSNFPRPQTLYCNKGYMPFSESPRFFFESNTDGALTITPIMTQPSYWIFMSEAGLVNSVTFSDLIVIGWPQYATMTVGGKEIFAGPGIYINDSSFEIGISVFSTPSIKVCVSNTGSSPESITQISFTDVTLNFSNTAYFFLLYLELFVWGVPLSIVGICIAFEMDSWIEF